MSQLFESALRANPKPKYIKITQKRLLDFTTLKPTQQRLLLNMISYLKLTKEPSSFIAKAGYKDFGYGTRQHYHEDKKALEAKEFIVTRGKEYFVRLDAIMYVSDTRYKHIMDMMGIWQYEFGTWGGYPDSGIVPLPPKE